MLRFSDVRDDVDSLDVPCSPQHFERLSASRRLKLKLQNDHRTSSRQTLSVAHSNAIASKLSGPDRNKTDSPNVQTETPNNIESLKFEIPW